MNETIVAPATGPGEYGIGIIRLSGPAAPALLQTFFHAVRPVGVISPRRLYFGHFCAGEELLDEVLAVSFPAPHSYTGEDCVEFHCHGGGAVMRRLLDELCRAGARLARPGEFTQRAFLNGRLDLSRAEAVRDLIHARSEGARRAALAQLGGSIFHVVHGLRGELADLLALVEAHVDFPEDELGALPHARLHEGARHCSDELRRLIAGYEQGRLIRDGASLLILGRPNVGKSSLLNLLVGEERAIVSTIPGTTRDTIEERIAVAQLPVRIIDSAGIRDSRDPIENAGVTRALQHVASADLILLVYDGSAGFLPEDAEVLARCGAAAILLVRNKADLPQAPAPLPPAHLPEVTLSTRDSSGLPAFHRTIHRHLLGSDGEVSDTALITDLRHKEALCQAVQALDSFRELLHHGAPLEVLACELRSSLDALGEITGETTPDEILDRIFARFCIGK